MTSDISRKDFIKVSGITTTGLLAGVANALETNSSKKPNLLVIQTDEHHYGTLGCYRDVMPASRKNLWGNKLNVETPNIDWLAKNGALCTRFYASVPVCSPSRGTFFTGCHPFNNGVTQNDLILKDEMISFATVLGKNGYKTGYSGKWHLDGHGKPQWDPDRNFGFEDNRYMFNRGHWKRMDLQADGTVEIAKKNGKYNYSVAGADEKSFTTDFLVDRTVEFIQKNHQDPFCYVVSIPDPHGPNTVRSPYDNMFDKDLISAPSTNKIANKDLPSWALPPNGRGGFSSKQQALYYGMVKCIDDNLAKIYSVLKKNKLMDNTIIVFTADHGDLCGEHGRHNKGVPLDGSAKIPFVVYYPKSIKAGTVIDTSLSTVDFQKTILSLMGIKASGKEDGRDASKLFTGKGTIEDFTVIRSTTNRGEPITTSNGRWIAGITKRYKIVLSAFEKPCLFDYEVCPSEDQNLFFDKKYRKIVADLAEKMVQYGKKSKDPYLSHSAIVADLNWAKDSSSRSDYKSPKYEVLEKKSKAKRKRSKNKKK